MKSAHKRGDRGHPCLTPLHTKTSLRPSLTGFYPFATLTSVLHLTDSRQSN